MENSISVRDKIFWLNIFAFLLSLHYAVVSYSASTFLSGLIEEKNIWLVYFFGALLAICLNILVSRFLRRQNISKIISTILFLEVGNLLILTQNQNIYLICLQFLFFYSLSALLYTLDSVALESLSKEDSIGGIRGRHNAILNMGYLVAPLFSAFFLEIYSIKIIFTLAATFGIFAFVMFRIFLSDLPKVSIPVNNFRAGFSKILKDKDILYIYFAQFGLVTFYLVSVIFVPFKLVSVGISLAQYLGILLPLALTPFLFMPPYLGHLEDKMHDEKQVLILALFGLILSLILIAFVDTPFLLYWGVILFFSRFCAASVEISTNSYFYKKINKGEVSLISIFTTLDYIAALIFTPFFSYLLFFTDLKTVFLTTSFFLTFVLVLVSKIHDLKNYEKHQNWRKIFERSRKRVSDK